jgi:hypothetical protein
MAKLPALVKTLSKRDQRSEAELTQLARVIREAGDYVPTVKRGGGAANMTGREAANMLLAVAGCEANKDATITIDRYRSLGRYGFVCREWDVFDHLAEQPTFGLALAALIEDMGNICRRFVVFLLDGFSDKPDHAKAHIEGLVQRGYCTELRLIVRLSRCPHSAEILAEVRTRDNDPKHAGNPFAAKWTPVFHAKYLMDVDRMSQGFYGNQNGRNTTVTIDFGELWDLWKTIADNDAAIEAAKAGTIDE